MQLTSYLWKKIGMLWKNYGISFLGICTNPVFNILFMEKRLIIYYKDILVTSPYSLFFLIQDILSNGGDSKGCFWTLDFLAHHNY